MNLRVGVEKRAAVASLILGRIVYAVNWFNLAAVFSLTAYEMNQNVSGLGLVTAMFYLGIGAFQLPGGILAAKIGPRLTLIYGTTVASLAALLTGFAGNLIEIAFLRFLVGLGMAFVFAPGVVLISRFLQKGSEGLAIGMYTSAFYVGGVVGLSGWAFLAGSVGWRNSLVISGFLGLLTSVLLFLSVPKDSRPSEIIVALPNLKLVLFDKWLIALSVALLGLGVATTVVGNFMAYYLENVMHVGVERAGTIASLTPIFATFTAPFSGRLFDKSGNAKQLVLASGVLMAVGVGIAFFGTIYSAIVSGILVGLASGAGFTFGFSAARAANKLNPDYQTLSVSWVNSFALFGDSVPPILFSYLVIGYGYSPSGLCMGMITFVFMVPLLLLKFNGGKGISVKPKHELA